MDKHNRKYNTTTGLENFILRLKENNTTVVYYSGYTNSENKVKLKCTICGDIFERYASCSRKGKKIRCFNCERLKLSQKEKKDFIVITGQQLQIKKCLQCGKFFYTDIEYKKYCSRTCSNKARDNKHTRIRIEKAKTNGSIDKDITLDKLIKRDHNTCYLCNKQCDSEDYYINSNGVFIAGNNYPSIDHIKPLTKGGTHTWGNIKLSHRRCNSIKNDRTVVRVRIYAPG